MYELQSTLAAYARRKFSSGEISVDHLKNILKVINSSLVYQLSSKIIEYIVFCFIYFKFFLICIIIGSPKILERMHSDI